ncbi:MAG TPA: folylpolyglutamate synthase/dihydrofolate synthase family protein [Cytophagales bacterium]|nr:folylpolyglutamate synthase/dihydrofolate synthase family protein [Cytophagales bacterium]
MMQYAEVESFLFNSFADFQKYGQSALIYDLSNIKKLCRALGNPQDGFKSIHVAGTNGKGSSSHMLASVLQESGYKVGLYTSPHLRRYTERIKVNGSEVEEAYVTDFVNEYIELLSSGKFSFFEITTAMAFHYFAKEKVDVAVIEVGLGGRLDATNIINPILCIITNISFDHVAILGDTIEKIANEKAGIIKKDVPIVVSEYTEESHNVFCYRAIEVDTDIYFASKLYDIKNQGATYLCIDKMSKLEFEVILGIRSTFQEKNLCGILCAVKILNQQGWNIKPDHLLEGLAKVRTNTNLKGRWQVLYEKPLVVCDTAHNEAGIKELMHQCQSLNKRLHFIMNFTKEKELSKLIGLLPQEASLHFCNVNNQRMRTASEIQRSIIFLGMPSQVHDNVNVAIATLRSTVPAEDAIIIFGSNFLIAEIENL